MKVISVHTMQEIDKQAIKEYGIPGLQLMENAGRRCVEEITAEFGLTGHSVIMAGRGNNGGDGFVVARLLSQKGWSVKVITLVEREQLSGNVAVNLERLPGSVVSYCTHEGQLSALHMEEIFQADVIVDAMIGTGLNSNVDRKSVV